jgi:hypothetical protein
MVRPSFDSLSSEERMPDSMLSSSAEALTEIGEFMEMETEHHTLQQWCANLPIDGDLRDRLAEIVDQVSSLRLKR